MNDHANQVQEKKENISAAAARQRKNIHTGHEYIDHRPGTVAQRKLQTICDNSPQVKATAQLQAISDSFTSRQRSFLQYGDNNSILHAGSKLSSIPVLSGRAMSAPRNTDQPVQRNAIKMEAEGLTEQMKDRFTQAYDQFSGTILAASPLATEANNHVVVHGVSQGSHGMRDYASTTIYFGNDGYQGEDYNQFTNLWEWSLHNRIAADTAIRIVIAVNLTANRTVEELYATLLHEWYAHAVKWAGTITYVRNDGGNFAVAWIQGQGPARREKGEHIEFANWTDQDIEEKVTALGLVDDQKANVISKMKTDRDRHDKNTGEIIR